MTNKGIYFVELLSDAGSAAPGKLLVEWPIRWVVGQSKPKRRGRPPGTGRPKVKRAAIVFTELGLKKLRGAGLTDSDVKCFYLWIEKGTFVAVAKELGVTPQAVHKRFHRRIFPTLKKISPKFSYQILGDQVRRTSNEINRSN